VPDNITVSQGTGTTMATDDIGGVQYPRVKLSLGADGTANDAVAGSGVVGTGVQRVVLATDVALPAGTNYLGLVGQGLAAVSATFARPADTTAYAAKDAVSNSTSSPTVLTFTGMARVSGGGGKIRVARLLTDQSTNTSLFRLHLFRTAPTAINDNAAYTLLWANRANRIGFIDFAALQTEGSGSDAAAGINRYADLEFVTSGSANLFGMLEVLGAFTPTSGQNFYIELLAEQY